MGICEGLLHVLPNEASSHRRDVFMRHRFYFFPTHHLHHTIYVADEIVFDLPQNHAGNEHLQRYKFLERWPFDVAHAIAGDVVLDRHQQHTGAPHRQYSYVYRPGFFY